MARKLITYLPEVLRNFREFEKTFESEQPEFEKLQDELSKVLKDLFVEDATERGVKRWEKLLKIVPKPSENLEDRKFKILSKLVKKLPYTYRRLEQLLEVLCGENGYLLEIVEGTTNGIQNGDFATGDFTGWTDWKPKNGNKSIVTHDGISYAKIELTTAGSSFGIESTKNISVQSGDKGTVSFRLRGEKPNYAYLMFSAGENINISSFIQYTDLPNGEYLGEYTWTADRAADVGFLFAYTDTPKSGEFTHAQLEKKPYRTPFTETFRPYNYTVKVRISLTRKSMFDDVKILLQEVVPANHIVDLSLLYNQHMTVGQYTHGELSTWTHDYIRNEVLN